MAVQQGRVPVAVAPLADAIPLSIIIPTWREGEALATLLHRLQPLRQCSVEILVADGEGSDTGLLGEADLADVWLNTQPGRAAQMQAAARCARGDVLAFVHVDSVFEERLLAPLLHRPTGWGFFQVDLVPAFWRYRLVAFCMNWRSRITRIGTGDQLLWVNAALFWQVGGFPDQKLMEDIALCRQLRRCFSPSIYPGRVETSARRWQQQGWLRTVLLMWTLRLRYWLGADPDELARIYYPQHTKLNDR